MALADDILAAGADLAQVVEEIAAQAIRDVIDGADPHDRAVPAVPGLEEVWEQAGPIIAIGVRNGAAIEAARIRAELDAAKATPPSVTSGSAMTLGAVVGAGLGYRLGRAIG